jgi:hypothetical protein
MNIQTTTMKGLNSANSSRTFALSLAVSLGVLAHGRAPLTNSGLGQNAQAGTMKAASCSPATQITQLAFNNVRAVIENGGNKWQRRGVGRSGYEIPKTEDFSGPSSIFSGGLWVGGISQDGQLKIAGVLYRTGGQNDYWPGPLTIAGDASVDADVCQAFDKFYTTTLAEAEAHDAYFGCNGDPDCITELFPNGYSTPASFNTWPAEGNVEAGQSPYLAPFYDANDDGVYDPSVGDHPDYGFDQTVDECKNKLREDPVPLFGDYNIYWIFNDKGDVHTETSGQPIGLEVRAQAFAFSSNNEINNMTFYNYTVINQGSQTLTNTYFGHFVDPDLGNADDDFTGCDVQRGMGFVYNWDDNDETTTSGTGYGAQPPAVGVDFFEGPFKDADGFDNPGPAQGLSCQQYQLDGGIPYDGIGIGYGDTVIDNERFGMRAFIYFNRESTNNNLTDPDNAIQFYNYLRSIWKNNREQSYGGTGYTEQDNYTRAFYMFPGSSDPLGWGTNCVPQAAWSEETPTLAQPDRRFVQSAGPFTLEPGAYNNVTVGVVWARAASGGAIGSLAPLRVADDKAQALFDNCFKILNGPDAPDLEIRELDRELLIYMKNPPGSNNFGQRYSELDPVIPALGVNGPNDRFYRFQGYKVYQLANSSVSVADLGDVNLARLIYQGDVEDGVGQIVNYPLSEIIGEPIPTEMVAGADDGVVNAIRVTEDLFAQGDPALVNYKAYYYLAIAYGYNNYQDYNVSTRTGQAVAYVVGRKGASGSIRSYTGIPRKPDAANGGTVANSQFGDELQVTRLEGQGNGGRALALEKVSEDAIMDGAPWRSDELVYKRGAGPIQVRVVDPLRVKPGSFELFFRDTITPGDLTDAYWVLYEQGTPNDSIMTSDRTIQVKHEQLLPDYGISITLGQAFYSRNQGGQNNAFTFPTSTGTIEFEDPSKAWFFGIPDTDGELPFNWIRSGTATIEGLPGEPDSPYNDRVGKDDEQIYEGLLGGTWAPWSLVGEAQFQPGSTLDVNVSMANSTISELPSIQVVFTKDKTKWSRSPVFEGESETSLSQGAAPRLTLRRSNSIDKDGRRVGTPGCNVDEANLVAPSGMGWFPGYAIDLETGERLNIAYSENSFWGGEIGRDMQWNPNDQYVTSTGGAYFGGGHWIYVFKNERRVVNNADRVSVYDDGAFIMSKLASGSPSARPLVFEAIGWVGSAVLAPGRQLLETDARVTLGVSKPYLPYVNYNGVVDPIVPQRNNGLPLYTFKTEGFLTSTGVTSVAEDFVDNIDVVPNPYYAFSGYETSRLDNRVRFINLPQTCNISIYNMGGTLVRQFKKDNSLPFLDWDLKNAKGIPIAGGVYICHVEAPGLGEKVIKWFGAMRPVDLQNF